MEGQRTHGRDGPVRPSASNRPGGPASLQSDIVLLEYNATEHSPNRSFKYHPSAQPGPATPPVLNYQQLLQHPAHPTSINQAPHHHQKPPTPREITLTLTLNLASHHPEPVGPDQILHHPAHPDSCAPKGPTAQCFLRDPPFSSPQPCGLPSPSAAPF